MPNRLPRVPRDGAASAIYALAALVLALATLARALR